MYFTREIGEKIAREGCVVIKNALTRPRRDLVLAEVGEMAFDDAPKEFDGRPVTQDFHMADIAGMQVNYPRTFGVIEEIESTVKEGFGDLLPRDFVLNNTVAQRYLEAHRGIKPHRDTDVYGGVVVNVILSGAAEFSIHESEKQIIPHTGRSGHHGRVWFRKVGRHTTT